MWKDQRTEPPEQNTQSEIHEHCERCVEILMFPGCDGEPAKAKLNKNLDANL